MTLCHTAMAQEGDAHVATRSHAADPWTSRPLAFEGQLGYANPFGTVAVALDVSPLAWLSIGAGVGFDPFGPQAGIMPRARFVTVGAEHRSALFIAAGVSVGSLCRSNDINAVTNCNPSDSGDYAYELTMAFWANTAVGYEWRSAGGLTLRLAIGIDALLNAGDATCHESGGDMCNHSMPGTVVPTFGLALGYAP